MVCFISSLVGRNGTDQSRLPHDLLLAGTAAQARTAGRPDQVGGLPGQSGIRGAEFLGIRAGKGLSFGS